MIIFAKCIIFICFSFLRTGTRKQEKRLRELAAQADEDRKSQERMQDMIDKLQQKIKTYKTQVESAVSAYELFGIRSKVAGYNVTDFGNI